MDFAKRLVEVEEILSYLVENERNKIPQKIFDFIRENKDMSYKWSIDKTKKLQDQDVPDDTFAILAYINMEYLLNAEQRQLMEQFYRLNDGK